MGASHACTVTAWVDNRSADHRHAHTLAHAPPPPHTKRQPLPSTIIGRASEGHGTYTRTLHTHAHTHARSGSRRWHFSGTRATREARGPTRAAAHTPKVLSCWRHSQTASLVRTAHAQPSFVSGALIAPGAALLAHLALAAFGKRTWRRATQQRVAWHANTHAAWHATNAGRATQGRNAQLRRASTRARQAREQAHPSLSCPLATHAHVHTPLMPLTHGTGCRPHRQGAWSPT
jgi:hypothetical protein